MGSTQCETLEKMQLKMAVSLNLKPTDHNFGFTDPWIYKKNH